MSYIQAFTTSLCFLPPPSSNSHSRDRETILNTVQHFLKSCQPFFNKLEAVARDAEFRPNPLPYDVSSKVL